VLDRLIGVLRTTAASRIVPSAQPPGVQRDAERGVALVVGQRLTPEQFFVRASSSTSSAGDPAATATIE